MAAQVHPQLQTVLLIAGSGDREQRQACEHGVDVVIGTPGAPHPFPLPSMNSCQQSARCPFDVT